MSNEIMKQLADPFAPEMEKTMSKGGTRLTYIPVSEVINRLNKVLGIDRWSFEVISCNRDAMDPEYIVAHIRFSWITTDKYTNADGPVITRDGIGGQKIKRTKAGDIVDLGDEMKGAVSDALKKAAQTLGVGLYLARSDDAMDAEDIAESPAPVVQQDKELADKWDSFTSVVKDFSSEQKAELNNYWIANGEGNPKPTKSTATHQSLDLLIAESVRISFGGEYANRAD